MFSILYQYETMLSSIVRGVCHQFCVLEKKERGETNLYCLSHPSVTFSLVDKTRFAKLQTQKKRFRVTICRANAKKGQNWLFVMDYLTIFLALFVFMRYEVCKSRKIGKGVFFGGERINQVKVRVDDMFLGAFRALSLIHIRF